MTPLRIQMDLQHTTCLKSTYNGQCAVGDNMSGVSLRHATGSAEALQEALSTDTVCIKILHMGVGPVSKANINKTATTNARIIAFNVKTDGLGLEAANKVAGVQVCPLASLVVLS